MVQTTNISIEDLSLKFKRRANQIGEARLLYHKHKLENKIQYEAYDKYVYDGAAWSLSDILRIADIRINKDHSLLMQKRINY